jgi:hypothetical protein
MTLKAREKEERRRQPQSAQSRIAKLHRNVKPSRSRSRCLRPTILKSLLGFARCIALFWFASRS